MVLKADTQVYFCAHKKKKEIIWSFVMDKYSAWKTGGGREAIWASKSARSGLNVSYATYN